MATRSVQLTERFNKFIDKQIEAGQFRDAGEVLQAGLRLLEEQARAEKAKLALLKKLAAEGFDQIDQGRGIVLENEQQLAEHINRIGERVATKTRGRRK
jgi:antitoxin ParD1/3/4